MQTLEEEAGGSRHLLYGLFYGTVEDIDDPEKLGRVRIRIAQIHSDDRDEIPTKKLPWAPLVAFGGFSNQGSYWTPVVGSQVVVGFFMGDPNNPICLGTCYRRAETPPEVTKRAAETTSNNSMGTQAFSGSNTAGTIPGATKTHVFKTPGSLKLVMDDAGPMIALESAMKQILTIVDASADSRIEIQSAANHNFTMWNKATEERIELTSKSGHRSTWDDRTASPSIQHVTAGGHIIRMTDVTSGPQILLQSNVGNYLQLANIGFGGVPEIRLATPGGQHLYLQQANDTVYCQTAGSAGLLAIGSGYCLVGTSTNYRIDIGGVGKAVTLSTPSTEGKVELRAGAQINADATGTMTLTSGISISLSAPIINLN